MRPGPLHHARLRREPLRHARNESRYRGRERYRWICERRSGGFLPYGLVSRLEAQCPRCGSLERHRLAWLSFKRRMNLFDSEPKRILHVARGARLTRPLQSSLGDGRLIADLEGASAMLRMDLMEIDIGPRGIVMAPAEASPDCRSELRCLICLRPSTSHGVRS